MSTIIHRSGIKTDLLLAKQSEIEQKRLLQPKVDIEIRWNSTYDMILRAIRLRIPLKSWLETQMEKDPSLDRLTLTNTDWKKLKYLIILLHPFAIYTNLIGSTKDTTINHTWNIYNRLFSHLEETKATLSKKNTTENPWIHEFFAPINAGFDMLKRYYTSTGGIVESQYAIAGILDPSQKLDMFKTNDWKAYDKKRYETIFVKHWDTYYKEYESTQVYDENDEDTEITQSLNSLFRLNRNTPGTRATKSLSEAEKFIRSPIETDEASITVLDIWKRLEPSYPTVSRMAKDILAIPGMSVTQYSNSKCLRLPLYSSWDWR
jgi:hypothetical protein